MPREYVNHEHSSVDVVMERNIGRGLVGGDLCPLFQLVTLAFSPILEKLVITSKRERNWTCKKSGKERVRCI